MSAMMTMVVVLFDSLGPLSKLLDFPDPRFPPIEQSQ